jgi:hypothetical protein
MFFFIFLMSVSMGTSKNILMEFFNAFFIIASKYKLKQIREFLFFLKSILLLINWSIDENES